LTKVVLAKSKNSNNKFEGILIELKNIPMGKSTNFNMIKLKNE
jgi:hypothetical protein